MLSLTYCLAGYSGVTMGRAKTMGRRQEVNTESLYAALRQLIESGATHGAEANYNRLE